MHAHPSLPRCLQHAKALEAFGRLLALRPQLAAPVAETVFLCMLQVGRVIRLVVGGWWLVIAVFLCMLQAGWGACIS